MRMRILVLALVTVFSVAPAGPARAILLTLEPAAQTVDLANPVALDLNISGLASFAAPSLGTWDVDIGFDPAILAPNTVVFGTELDLFGFGSIQDVVSAGAGIVNLFELSFDLPADLDALQAGAFTLATLTFDTLAAGTSPLTIAINALGDALGDPLAASVVGASVTVNAPVSVPEPETFLLFLFGLAVVAALRRVALEG